MNEELNLPNLPRYNIEMNGAGVAIGKRSLPIQATILRKNHNIFLMQLQEIIFDRCVLIIIKTSVCITVLTVLTIKYSDANCTQSM